MSDRCGQTYQEVPRVVQMYSIAAESIARLFAHIWHLTCGKSQRTETNSDYPDKSNIERENSNHFCWLVAVGFRAQPGPKPQEESMPKELVVLPSWQTLSLRGIEAFAAEAPPAVEGRLTLVQPDDQRLLDVRAWRSQCNAPLPAPPRAHDREKRTRR